MKESPGQQEKEWLSIQIKKYKENVIIFDRLTDILRSLLQYSAEKYTRNGIVHARTKTITSFAEKVLKKKEKYSDPLRQATDLSAGRVITYDINEVKQLCNFIKDHLDIDWNNSIDIDHRLKSSEFGYRSVHYIISFNSTLFKTADYEIIIPDELIGLKAEIQVRTILEHVWAEFKHNTSYKGGITTLYKWERELARISALLETADKMFSGVIENIQESRENYNAYLTEAQIKKEIEYLEIILEEDPENVELAFRIGKLAMAVEDWKKAITVFSKYLNRGFQPIIRDLGICLCKLHGKMLHSEEYNKGLDYLREAIALNSKDIDALTSLASAVSTIDGEKAHNLYRQAFEINHSIPYVLSNFLTHEIAYLKNLSPVSMTSYAIHQSIRKCCDQIEVSVNLPWAYFDLGKFFLFLGKPYESLSAYGKGIESSTASWMLETTLKSHKKLDCVSSQLTGYEWILKLLDIAIALRSSEKDVQMVSCLDERSSKKISEPVIVITGNHENQYSTAEHESSRYLLKSLLNYSGTIISDGVSSGTTSLIGEAQALKKELRSIGYLPEHLPPGLIPDIRYGELRTIKGAGFSPLQPLQYWTDIIKSGIHPSSVKVFAIGGDNNTAAELIIAIALGACVIVYEECSQPVLKILKDELWGASRLLYKADKVTFKAFLDHGNKTWICDESRETIAKSIHESYRADQIKATQENATSLRIWEHLPEHLKESNRQQTDHFLEKLNEIGYAVREKTGKQIIKPIELNDDEVEYLAEIEHARWNVERFLSGWTFGEHKDVEKKITPYLISWKELPEEIKELDRKPVRRIPEILTQAGFEIYREKQDSSGSSKKNSGRKKRYKN